MKKDVTKVVDTIRSTKNSKLMIFIFPLLIIIAVLICYYGTYDYPFQLDDYVNFVYPHKIHDLSYFTQLKNWTDPVSRPLSSLTLALNYNFNKEDPTYYHVVNVVIHIMNGLLVFLLTFQISRFFMKREDIKSRHWFAFLTALLFVTHPLQIQGVTYLVQRMTSMAAFFYLLSVYLYGEGRIRHSEKQEVKPAIWFYVLTFISLVLAIESKPNTASLPLMYLLYELCFIRTKEGKPYWKFIKVYSAILVGGFAIIVLTGKLPSETDTINRFDYLLTQFKVVTQYLWMLFIPKGMTIDHDVAVVHKITFFIGLCALLLSGLICAAVASFKRNPLITFAIGLFFIALSVESTIIPIRDVMFEHRLYISLLGFALIIVYTAWKYLYSKNQVLTKVLILLIVFLWGGLTINRNKVWESEEALWLDAAVKSPAKSRVFRMLGDIYLKQNRLTEAYDKYQESITLDPKDHESYINRGAVLEKMQKYEEAWQSYMIAYKMVPNNTVLLYNMGHAAMKMRDYPLAISYFNKVLTYRPIQYETYIALASIYETHGDFEQARIMYKKALDSPRTSFKANQNLGISYLAQEDGKSAIPYFMKAIEINPADASVYHQLGSAYANISRMNESRPYWEKALEIDPSYTLALDDLGVLEYDNRNYAKAVELWEKSLQIDITQPSMYGLIIDAYKKLGNTERQSFFEAKAKELGYSTKL